MNRIDTLFLRRNQNILSAYFTAGYPDLDDTADIIKGLEASGADMIEIGFPFSDPVADGPVIQKSSHQALAGGMNLDLLFEQLKGINTESEVPRILMGYFNTVLQYGVERFLERCSECGIDGAILPDLPPELYEERYKGQFEEAGIHFICLVAPQTSPERILYLSSVSRGFLYLLSSSSITGQKGAIPENRPDTPTRASYSLPTLVGFGIHDHTTFNQACNRANGGIIGSEFIRRLTTIDAALTGDTRRRVIFEVCTHFIHEIRTGK